MIQRSKTAAALAAIALSLSGCKKKPAPAPAPPPTSAPAPAAPTAPANPTAANGSNPAAPAPAGCNSDFKQPITASTTLTAKCSPYTLDHELSVDGWDLTIEPGVTIKFTEDGKLSAGWNDDARITARGTAEQPIELVSGGRQEPGAWAGVGLFEHARGSSLSHVVIENAGRDDKPAIEIHAADVHLSHVKVVASKDQAFALMDHARVVAFDGNDFTQAGPHEVIGTFVLQSLGGIAPGNLWPKGSVIQVDQDATDGDLSIPNAGIPYRILHDVSVDAAAGKSAVVTVAPGVVFQMDADTEWSFGWNQSGGAIMVGTEQAPITFTRFGNNPEKGSWKGLAFNDHTKQVQLRYVKIEDAGEKDSAAIRYANLRSLGELTHVTVIHAVGSAVVTHNGGATFKAFGDDTFADVGAPALELQVETAHNLGAGNVYPPGAVIQLDGAVNQDTTLTMQSAPYQLLSDLSVDGPSPVKTATLSVAPGATFQFATGTGIAVGWNQPGALSAVGNLAKPVVLPRRSTPGTASA